MMRNTAEVAQFPMAAIQSDDPPILRASALASVNACLENAAAAFHQPETTPEEREHITGATDDSGRAARTAAVAEIQRRMDDRMAIL